jgi:hypothetical protein
MATFLQRIKDSSFAEFRISGLEAGRARTALGYLKKEGRATHSACAARSFLGAGHPLATRPDRAALRASYGLAAARLNRGFYIKNRINPVKSVRRGGRTIPHHLWMR